MISRNKPLSFSILHIQTTVNGPQNFAVTRAGKFQFQRKYSLYLLWPQSPVLLEVYDSENILQSWRKYTEYGEKGRKPDWLQFVLCRSSLLKDIDTTVYGSHVKVLPTEDFLSVRVLVSFSPLPQFPLSEVNKCLQP
jgi:hypothetical protein